MNEYVVTIEIKKQNLFFPSYTTDAFAVEAKSAVEARALAMSGMVAGLDRHRPMWDGEIDMEDVFDIRVTDIRRI